MTAAIPIGRAPWGANVNSPCALITVELIPSPPQCVRTNSFISEQSGPNPKRLNQKTTAQTAKTSTRADAMSGVPEHLYLPIRQWAPFTSIDVN